MPPNVNIPQSDLEKIISGQDQAQLLVRWSNDLGSSLARNLTTSQIRALFGEVRQIQAQWSMGGVQREQAYRRLVLLKPKMAYRARKERGQAVKALVDVLDPAVDIVIKSPEAEKDIRFQHFVEFFEAILAYHKASGGN